jgi:hypothetical protein
VKLDRKDTPRVYQDLRPLSRESLIRGERLAARGRAGQTIAISLWIIAAVAILRGVIS